MKHIFSNISKFLVMGLIILSGSLFFLNETGFAEDPVDPALSIARTNLENAQKNLSEAREAEQKALEALNAKIAERESKKQAKDTKGVLLKDYIIERDSLIEEKNKLNNSNPEDEKRLKEIEDRLKVLTGDNTNKGEIDKLNEEITKLLNDINQFQSSNEQQDYDAAQQNTQAKEQKVKEAEAEVKRLEASLCIDEASEECKQKKLDANKASQDADQKAYDEAISCKTACDNQPEQKEECYKSCKNLDIINQFEENARQILSAEQELYKYQTLKELTFDVESILNIDPMVVGEQKYTAQEKPYFSDTKNTPIFSFILRVIDFAIRIIGSIAVLIIIIAGFILVISVGNDTRIEQGKNAIKYALMGLAIAFMSYTIVLFVQAIFSN